jgi:hypothetical protein
MREGEREDVLFYRFFPVFISLFFVYFVTDGGRARGRRLSSAKWMSHDD